MFGTCPRGNIQRLRIVWEGSGKSNDQAGHRRRWNRLGF